jgi:hypothetical protein
VNSWLPFLALLPPKRQMTMTLLYQYPRVSDLLRIRSRAGVGLKNMYGIKTPIAYGVGTVREHPDVKWAPCSILTGILRMIVHGMSQ